MLLGVAPGPGRCTHWEPVRAPRSADIRKNGDPLGPAGQPSGNARPTQWDTKTRAAKAGNLRCVFDAGLPNLQVLDVLSIMMSVTRFAY